MKLDTLRYGHLEIVQSARTVTLLQIITALLPVLIFAITSLSVAYLLKYITLLLTQPSHYYASSGASFGLTDSLVFFLSFFFFFFFFFLFFFFLFLF